MDGSDQRGVGHPPAQPWGRVMDPKRSAAPSVAGFRHVLQVGARIPLHWPPLVQRGQLPLRGSARSVPGGSFIHRIEHRTPELPVRDCFVSTRHAINKGDTNYLCHSSWRR